MASSSNEFVRRIENAVNPAHREQAQKMQAEYDAAIAAAEKRHQSDMERIRVNYEKEITAVRDSHRNAIQQIESGLERITTSLQGSAFAWDHPFWKNYAPITTNSDVPPFTRLGALTAQGNYTTIQTPALLPIIGGQNVLIKASGAAKDRALEAMQSLMLRLLTYYRRSVII